MVTFNKTVEGTTLCIAPVGSIDASNAAAFHDEVSESLAGMSEVVFDCAGLEYISSAGLRVLLATQKAFGAPGAVRMRNVSEEVAEVLRVTRLAQFLAIE